MSIFDIFKRKKPVATKLPPLNTTAMRTAPVKLSVASPPPRKDDSSDDILLNPLHPLNPASAIFYGNMHAPTGAEIPASTYSSGCDTSSSSSSSSSSYDSSSSSSSDSGGSCGSSD